MDKIKLIVRAADAKLSGFDFLSDEEKRRAEQKHGAVRPLYVTARAILRQQLGQILKCSPHEVPLEQKENGPVTLIGSGTQNLYFSISHTSNADTGIVAVGVSEHTPLGVDIEIPDRQINWMRLAKRRFPMSDYKRMALLPSSEARLYFYKLWTLRESLVKMENGKLLTYLKEARIIFKDAGPKMLGLSPAGRLNVNLHFDYCHVNNLMIGLASVRKVLLDFDVDIAEQQKYVGVERALDIPY